MRPLYHEINNQIEVFTKENNLLPPHLHQYVEYIYVTSGHLLLRTEDRQIEMEPRDLAVIFPDVIHGFDVDPSLPSQAIYALKTLSPADPFYGILRKYCPLTPVIPKDLVPPDIPHTLHALFSSRQNPFCLELQQAYFQILLAKTLPLCHLAEKKSRNSPTLPGRLSPTSPVTLWKRSASPVWPASWVSAPTGCPGSSPESCI